MKANLYFVLVGCFFLMAITLYLIIQSLRTKQSELDRIIQHAITAGVGAKNKLEGNVTNVSAVKKHENYLEQMIKLTNSERNATNLIRFEFYTAFITVVLIVLSLIFIGSPIITIGLFIAGTVIAVAPEIELRSSLQKKYIEFDRILPEFIEKVVLSMNAGYNMNKAFIVATRSLTGPIQAEFQKFLLDTQKFSDDMAMPYKNLSQRIPTNSCKRFCSVVITGLTNGNSMKDILNTESDYLNEEILVSLEKQGRKNETMSTAVSTGLIFLPIIALMIAPIIATSV